MAGSVSKSEQAPAPKGAGSRELVVRAWIMDVVVCAAIAGVGLWFLLKALPMPPGRTMIGVGTFPKIVSALLIGLCVMQAVGSFIGREKGGNMVTRRPLMVAIAIALVLLFPTAMDRFGYYLSAAIWVPAFAWVGGMREVGSFAAITAAVLGLAYFVFENLLGTPLS